MNLKKAVVVQADVDQLEEEPKRGRSPKTVSSEELGKLYDESSARILQERNDFFLPQVRDLIAVDKWVNLRPEYQRRHRWDEPKQSKLIESLLMNVPVPPVYLFEREFSRYEVMDGQQRLISLIDFYQDKLKLSGLEAWPGLNGLTYKSLPTKIQRGLDRRRISAVILLKESVTPKEFSTRDIRQEVFARLNTGGTALNHQELRNCIFSGPFNQLIVELAGTSLFRKMWDIPNPPAADQTSIPPALRDNKLFQTMGDCQIVLRFFAFREKAKIVGSVRHMLDKSMEQYQYADVEGIEQMRTDFVSRLETVNAIFGVAAFKLDGKKGLSRPLFDALMIATDRLWSSKNKLKEKKATLRAALNKLLKNETSYEIIVGRPNTAAAVRARIDLIEKSFRSAIR
jgi:hypothetical protein